MKNSIKTTVSAFLLALVFSFAGCQNGLNEDATSAKDAAAKIVVSIDSATRTLGPDAASLTYRLVVTNNTQTIKVEEPVTGTSITKELDAGTWTVSVFAYTGTNLVGEATQADVILAEGETKEVSLVVQPLTNKEVAGTFSWELTLQGTDHTITLTTATLTPTSPNSAQTSPIQLSNFPSGSVPLPAGQYTLDLTATSNRQISGNSLTAVRKEVVYIYPHLTTDASLTFTDADFDAEVYFSGTAASIHVGGVVYQPITVYLQLADSTAAEAPIASTYEWEISALSKEISNDANLSTVRFRYEARNTFSSTPRYSQWQTVSVSDIVGKTNIALHDYQVPANVSASFTNGSYPLTNRVEWYPVSAPSGYYLMYYTVHRNGSYVGEATATSTVYEDNTGVAFGNSYTYTVIAHYRNNSNTISISSEQSTPSTSFTTPTVENIGVGSNTTKFIPSGEYQYFQVDVPSSSYYSYYFYLVSTEVNINVKAGIISSSSLSNIGNYTSSDQAGTHSNIAYTYSDIIVVVRNTSSVNGTYTFYVNN